MNSGLLDKIPIQSNRRHLALLLIFAGAAVMICIIDRAPMHLQSRFPEVRIQGEFQEYLDGVVDQTLPGPYVYRIFVPYLIFSLHKSLPLINMLTWDFGLKILILVFCQLAFFNYLRSFFSGMAALAGVLWFDILIGVSLFHIQGPSVIETADLMNVLIFSLALLAIYRGRFILLCAVLFVGTFNRETTWILLPILFLREWFGPCSWRRLLVAVAVVALPYFSLRWLITSPTPIWFLTQDIRLNIPLLSPQHTWGALVANLHLLFLLGPLIVLGIYRFREHPVFLRIAASIAPLFIIIHYIVGSIRETRLWMPLYLLLIPLALDNLIKLLPDDDNVNIQRSPTSTRQDESTHRIGNSTEI
ncbi:hypothetical protein L0337_34205 [candidate division KSB1 bacterium]|nr:hypothetical protein [candidate division KSB1 bacterium]